METALPEILSAAIGERVRRHRQLRGYTLDQMAEIAGVSRRTLVNVEQGSANPSVATLLRLSGALGVGLPALVEPPATEPVKITWRGDGPVLWQGRAGSSGVLVSSSAGPEVVELWDWTLAPLDRHHSEAHVPGTRELLRVWEGTIELTVGGSSSVLEAGDAASFSGDAAHAYANPSADHHAVFSLVVYEPGTPGGTRTEPVSG
jgi:transcriptional regulator with XRE-family HTH domain